MAKITVLQLRTLHACKEQRHDFIKTFGREVEVTEELARDNAEHFDLEWAAFNLLDRSLRVEFTRATGAAWRQYDNDARPYREARIAAMESFGPGITDGQWKAAWDKYDDDVHPVYLKLKEAEALAFAKAYNDERNAERWP